MTNQDRSPKLEPAPDRDSELLLRLLDGELSTEESRAVHTRMEHDSTLRDRFEMMRAVEDGVRTQFAFAEAPELRVEGAPSQPRQIGLAVAACLMLAVAAALLAQPWNWFSKPSIYGPRTPLEAITLAEAHPIVLERFTPDWICSTDDEFRRFTRAYLGLALTVSEPVPASIELVGWRYAGWDPFEKKLLGRNAQALLCTVGDDRVVVYIDRKHHDRELSAPPGLALHRAELTDGKDGSAILVAYEVTPLDEPQILPLLRAAE